MIKRITSILMVVTVLVIVAAPALASDDIETHRSCSYCGMDRKAYGFSRMLVRYADGLEKGVCSLHCAVTEMYENPAHKVQVLLVADRDTQNLIDASAAYWVMGGKKRGVMTQRAKWAFKTPEAAQAFVERYGGGRVSWDAALAAAREDAAVGGRR